MFKSDLGMEGVPLHGCEMGISIQYHVMLIRQLNGQILMRCYIVAFILMTTVFYWQLNHS